MTYSRGDYIEIRGNSIFFYAARVSVIKIKGSRPKIRSLKKCVYSLRKSSDTFRKNIY